MEVYFFCSFLLGMLIENHRFIHHLALSDTHTHTVSFSLLSSFSSRGQVVTGGSD